MTHGFVHYRAHTHAHGLKRAAPRVSSRSFSPHQHAFAHGPRSRTPLAPNAGLPHHTNALLRFPLAHLGPAFSAATTFLPLRGSPGRFWCRSCSFRRTHAVSTAPSWFVTLGSGLFGFIKHSFLFAPPRPALHAIPPQRFTHHWTLHVLRFAFLRSGLVTFCVASPFCLFLYTHDFAPPRFCLPFCAVCIPWTAHLLVHGFALRTFFCTRTAVLPVCRTWDVATFVLPHTFHAAAGYISRMDSRLRSFTCLRVPFTHSCPLERLDYVVFFRLRLHVPISVPTRFPFVSTLALLPAFYPTHPFTRYRTRSASTPGLRYLHTTPVLHTPFSHIRYTCTPVCCRWTVLLPAITVCGSSRCYCPIPTFLISPFLLFFAVCRTLSTVDHCYLSLVTTAHHRFSHIHHTFGLPGLPFCSPLPFHCPAVSCIALPLRLPTIHTTLPALHYTCLLRPQHYWFQTPMVYRRLPRCHRVSGSPPHIPRFLFERPFTATHLYGFYHHTGFTCLLHTACITARTPRRVTHLPFSSFPALRVHTTLSGYRFATTVLSPFYAPSHRGLPPPLRTPRRRRCTALHGNLLVCHIFAHWDAYRCCCRAADHWTPPRGSRLDYTWLTPHCFHTHLASLAIPRYRPLHIHTRLQTTTGPHTFKVCGSFLLPRTFTPPLHTHRRTRFILHTGLFALLHLFTCLLHHTTSLGSSSLVWFPRTHTHAPPRLRHLRFARHIFVMPPGCIPRWFAATWDDVVLHRTPPYTSRCAHAIFWTHLFTLGSFLRTRIELHFPRLLCRFRLHTPAFPVILHTLPPRLPRAQTGRSFLQPLRHACVTRIRCVLHAFLLDLSPRFLCVSPAPFFCASWFARALRFTVCYTWIFRTVRSPFHSFALPFCAVSVARTCTHSFLTTGAFHARLPARTGFRFFTPAHTHTSFTPRYTTAFYTFARTHTLHQVATLV